ncbi:imelysin family protein [Sedimentitalea sp. JM2-8]|uniref:Imelysin family protein n=1 Tax=Sedimentitalea xiamensis TaxID=3050037 RepID=A0ABT7FHR9_9RHOB|nr:imelysin family protein [Sedimentitalea xiamensis]MDK3074595.1 imelysin family protein [Sedimentitalea xiamensis]
MKRLAIFLAMLTAAPAAAQVDAVIDDHILPGYAAFSETAAGLRDTAVRDCGSDALRPAWNETFDAWLGVSHLTFGPVEQDGRSVAVAFWPDERGATPRALTALIGDQDRIIDDPQGAAELSVAARGLHALEYLLYDDRFAGSGAYGCALMRALTADLAALAEQIDDAWRSGYARTLRTAGAPDNTVYLGEREARQALFTALTTGLEFTADQRLGRPMGTFERPRPTRAESWRSGRSQRNVILSLQALSGLARELTDAATPQTDAAFARAIGLAERLGDPALAGVAEPSGRLRVEVVQQAVRAARDAVLEEIGPSLGVSAGFNSADGD